MGSVPRPRRTRGLSPSTSVANYCPRFFEGGCNLTPTSCRWPSSARRWRPATRICASWSGRCSPRVIGIGNWAEKRASEALAGLPGVKFGCRLHPSPASPAANPRLGRGSDEAADGVGSGAASRRRSVDGGRSGLRRPAEAGAAPVLVERRKPRTPTATAALSARTRPESSISGSGRSSARDRGELLGGEPKPNTSRFSARRFGLTTRIGTPDWCQRRITCAGVRPWRRATSRIAGQPAFLARPERAPRLGDDAARLVHLDVVAARARGRGGSGSPAGTTRNRTAAAGGRLEVRGADRTHEAGLCSFTRPSRRPPT